MQAMKSKQFIAWVLATLAYLPAQALEQRAGLTPCRLPGVEHDAWCGSLQRPLDPKAPHGVQINLHYAVLPALARNRKPDPVFFFAGGPGQSAMSLAGPVSVMMARLSNRRDVVLIDQRGTGRSAPLKCEDERPTLPLAQSADPAAQTQRLLGCLQQLQNLPHGKAGGLRHYSTWVAMQDADAVRQALGATQVNLVGGSYGTRAALEYLRQFPKAVRRVVIDGVAPPDMVLPSAFSPDNQAALESVFSSCQAQPACQQRYPALRADWQKLLAGLPRSASVLHPVSGVAERITISRDLVLSAVRVPLYVPALAAGLPWALSEAAQSRFEPLLGLSSAMSGNSAGKIYEGMHFSVVCAEDLPRLAQASDKPGADYGDTFAEQYKKICADWPRAEVPAAFYSMAPAASAVLLLSGGADPATPPRHGERVAKALGTRSRHVVVPNAGHGVMAMGCMRDAIFKFIDANSDDEALKVDATCAAQLPRPGAFVPLAEATPAANPGSNK
jgi:pimeloyl-ACP methyl ester carboxylesterase